MEKRIVLTISQAFWDRIDPHLKSGAPDESPRILRWEAGIGVWIPVRVTPGPVFSPGRLVMAPGFITHAGGPTTEAVAEAARLVERHTQGDHGDTNLDGCEANELAWQLGQRIISRYHHHGAHGTAPVLVITDAARTYTTVLRADERH